MNEISSSNIDYKRPIWGEGEWNHEPDRIQWIDDFTGYTCLIKRNHFGALCGYVAIPGTHPMYGKNYDDIEVVVHGGLTYSDRCDGYPDTGICHPAAEDDDIAWWCGFDCGHAGDLMPKHIEVMKELADQHPHLSEGLINSDRLDTYKNVAFVKEQCDILAIQLKGMA